MVAIGVWRSTTGAVVRGRGLRDFTKKPKHTIGVQDVRVHRLRPQWPCRGRGRLSSLGRLKIVSRTMLHSARLCARSHSRERSPVSRPSNFTLERTAGSHSLAASAQRERWTDHGQTRSRRETCGPRSSVVRNATHGRGAAGSKDPAHRHPVGLLSLGRLGFRRRISGGLARTGLCGGTDHRPGGAMGGGQL